MEHLSACPVCNNRNFETHLNSRDYFLTSETFSIVRCISCDFLFTNPRPEKNVIGNYYKSETYISHSDTSRGFVNKVYQSVRNRTLKQKSTWISNHKGQGRVLDIGAGTGHFLKTIIEKGYSGVGLEPEEEARKLAKTRFDLNLYEDLESVTKIENQFDVITLWHVLEHVHELKATLDKIRSLLSTGGILVIAVPNPQSYDANYYGKYWAAYDLPRHLYHFTRGPLIQLMESYRYKLIQTYPMKFDSYYVSMLSEKYRTGKTNYFNASLRGFLSNFYARNKQYNYSSLTYIFTNKK